MSTRGRTRGLQAARRGLLPAGVQPSVGTRMRHRRHRRPLARIVKNATAAPARQSPALIRSATPAPSASAAPRSCVNPPSRRRAAGTAVPSKPASLAVALLTAEATPARSSGTAPSTAAVSGATSVARPTPKSGQAGHQTRSRYLVPGPTPESSSRPRGGHGRPDGHREPARRPGRSTVRRVGEIRSMSRLSGMRAAPEARAL